MSVVRAEVRNRLLHDARWRCQHCGWEGAHHPNRAYGKQPEQYLTLDHVVPRAAGGPTQVWNLVVLCNLCNQAKGAAFWPHLLTGRRWWAYRRWVADRPAFLQTPAANAVALVPFTGADQLLVA